MRRREQRGFTLVELTVALAAGLIVALGIVALSRDATRTFHEEMRSSAAEESLRTAVDRLRADLGRAGFMSTSDIVTDTAIARPPTGGATIPKTWGLAKLASIQIIPGKALTQTPLSVKNGLNPDAIWIGGDMTTSDLYSATLQPIGGAPAAGSNGCTPLYLTGTSPAMLRLIGASGAAAAQDLNNAFQPAPGGQFIVRVLDRAGHTQYLATCAGAPTALPSATQPVLFVAAAPPFLQSSTSSGQAQISGFDIFWVNPVQIVQYRLVAAANEAVQYTTSPLGGLPLTAGEDPTKYDLVRSYIDAVTGLEIAGTQEIIAEYAVDLAFSLTVDTGLALAPTPVSFPFDNVNNALWAKDVTTLAAPIVNDPKRIRAVRLRLVTRAAQADRTLNVPVPGTAGTFLYRYCVVAAGCDPVNTAGILQYARARTVTAEVSLPNQAGAY